jgi:hypothetical protein
MKRCHLFIFAGLLSIFIIVGKARSSVIDFEDLPELDSVTNQYQNLGPTFLNATVLTAGSSLNEVEFPPFSGVNVIYDSFGPIKIAFSQPVTVIGAYLTYRVPITMNAYNSSGTLIGSDGSDFLSNMPLSGDPGSASNEYLTFASPGGISAVEIVGDPSGNSYVLDNLYFDTGNLNLIELDQFTTVSQHNQIVIIWSTLSEIDNAGFNLWRGEAGSTDYIKINSGIIEAVGDATLSAEYSYIDKTAIPGVVYYYTLEDIDIKGISTFHGPISGTIVDMGAR